MSVGTGGSVEGDRLSLASALAFSLIRKRPDRIIFFVSNESRSTVRLISDSYKEKTGEDLPAHEFEEFPNVDSFDTCFTQVSQVILRMQTEGFDVVIDYTSGTKTMTMVMGVAAVLHHCVLTLVEGTRDEHGKVRSGSERVSEQTLYPVYDHMLFADVIRMFHAYRFAEALEILEKKIVAHEYRDEMMCLCRIFQYWDQLEYAKAGEWVEKMDREKVGKLIPGISKKVEYLKKLTSKNQYLKEAREDEEDKRLKEEERKKAKERVKKNLEPKYKLILADLICNARRRIEEGKYEDAVARLYRSVELVAQIKLLQKAGLDDLEGTGLKEDLVLQLLPEDVKGKYRSRAMDGMFLFGARAKYELLSDLGQKNGWPKALEVYQGIEGDLKKRNRSVLAHGITPITKEDAEKMEEKVRHIAARALDEDVIKMGDYMRDAEFPRIVWE